MSTQGRFTDLKRLGDGTYGVVYRAKEIATGNVYALKRMNIPNEEEGVPATTIREICLLKELRHRNIVHLIDVLFQAPKLTLVFEYCPYDLKKFMEVHGKPLEPSLIESFGYQLLCGLAFIHHRCIVHRDLKPQNLLVSDTHELKVADFGLARVEGIPVKKYSHEAVTLWYRSPDVILGTANYGLAVDMWSVGCIMVEMATGVTLFDGRSDAEQLAKIFRLLGSPRQMDWPSMSTCPSARTLVSDNAQLANLPSTLNELLEDPKVSRLGPHFADFVKQCFHYEPSRRITAADALRHRYFATVAAQLSYAIAAAENGKQPPPQGSSSSSTPSGNHDRSSSSAAPATAGESQSNGGDVPHALPNEARNVPAPSVHSSSGGRPTAA